MNGGEAVTKALEVAEVSHVFGLLGSTTMEVDWEAMLENQEDRDRR